MANREENLKKINAELEQLSDEELEKVAGGGSTGHYTPFRGGVPIGIDNISEDAKRLAGIHR